MNNMSYENRGLEIDKIDKASHHNFENDNKILDDVIEPTIEAKTVNDVEGGRSTKPRTTNYDKRKTIAHGMMDTALISANANQLKFIIQFYKTHNASFWVLVSLIVLSLIIQVAVGVGLIFRQKKKIKNKDGEVIQPTNTHPLRDILTVDEFIIMGVFLVIVINIFVAAFSTGDSGVAAPPVSPNSSN